NGLCLGPVHTAAVVPPETKTHVLPVQHQQPPTSSPQSSMLPHHPSTPPAAIVTPAVPVPAVPVPAVPVPAVPIPAVPTAPRLVPPLGFVELPSVTTPPAPTISTAPSPKLAFTGSNAADLLSIGLGLTVVGVALAGFRPRHR